MTLSIGRTNLVLLLFVLFARPVLAQAGIQVGNDDATVRFSTGIVFNLQASSSSRISSVTLHYGILGRPCVTSEAQQVLSFTPSQSVDLNWQLDFKRAGVLPPGVQFWWQWEIHDDSGAQLLTNKQTGVVSDSSYAWQSLSRAGVTVTWSEGNQAFGAQLLDRAVTGLARLNLQMGVRSPGPVTLIVYPTAEAVRQAMVFVPEWTGGLAYPEYGVIVLGIAPGETAWAATVIPHELAHLVVGALVFNCLGVRLPVWLDEGLAVVAQGPANPNDLAELSGALRSGALPSLRSLAGGFQADYGRAALSYTQSGEVVRYLIATYGTDRLLALLAAVQHGNPADAALLQTYGFDTDGLDAAWRAAQGAPEQATLAPAATAAEMTAVPTLALWTAVSPATATPQPASPPPPRIPVTITASPAPSPTLTMAPTEAPTRAVAPTSPGSACLFGGAALLIGSLVVLASVGGLRFARGTP